jgi:hypothetical protein
VSRLGARATATYSGVDLVPLLEQATRLQLGDGLSVRMNTNVSFYANADYHCVSDGSRLQRRPRSCWCAIYVVISIAVELSPDKRAEHHPR